MELYDIIPEDKGERTQKMQSNDGSRKKQNSSDWDDEIPD